MPVVRQIVRNAAKDNYRFASIVSQVVVSDAFRRREPATGAAKVNAALPSWQTSRKVGTRQAQEGKGHANDAGGG